ncbi:MAG: tetratricopeptide repeat protein [Gammaproteobacteria bacterium]
MPHAARISACLAVLVAGGLLSACSTQPPLSPAARIAAAEASGPAKVVPGTWSADTLYDLLVGEIAGQRDQLDISLDAYLRQAKSLRDPALAERATRIAWYARDRERIREATLLWVELAPQDPEANANAVMGLIQAGEIEAATPLLDRLLADSATPVRFNFILQYALVSEPDVRTRLASLLAGLSERHAGNAQLWLARATLADMRGEAEDALKLAQRSRAIEPHSADAIELEGRLLAAAGHTRKALRLLHAGSREFPDQRDLRLTHLRVLLENSRGDDARDELADMRTRWPDDGDLALSLAVVEWETGHPARAKELLIELAGSGYREDDAWHYAGRVALSEGKHEEAIGYFQNVRGPQFLAAQIQVAYALQKTGRLPEARRLLAALRAQAPESTTQLHVAESDLLARAGDPQAAFALLDEALAGNPDDPDLRYARAMAAERLGKIDLVESDLRALLSEHPENPMVLNALGYTLTDRTDRHEEARLLIERALALSPEDPAIIDSMGWVLFRLGRAEEALPWLRRAYARSPDAEIAAHLGEVLWSLGKKREARRTWERARKIDPDNAALKRTMERLLP